MTKPRNYNLDLLKIFAMFGVICLHTTRPFADSDTSLVSIASVMYRTAVYAIPMFFLVSGYLLCGRKDVSYKYVMAKCFRIVRYILIFCIGYWLLHIPQDQFSIKVLIKLIVDSVHGAGPFYVFWYFGAFMLVLLFLPWIAKLYHHSRYYSIVTLFLILVQSIVFSHNLTLGGGKETLCTTYRLYNWLTYFMIGGIIHKIKIFKQPALVLMLLFILNLYNQLSVARFIQTTAASFFYSSIVTVALVVYFAATILKIKIKSNNRIIIELSKLFLPVFTIHSFFLDPVLWRVALFGSAAPIIAFVSVSFISIISSWLLMKIPYINHVVKI